MSTAQAPSNKIIVELTHEQACLIQRRLLSGIVLTPARQLMDVAVVIDILHQAGATDETCHRLIK